MKHISLLIFILSLSGVPGYAHAQSKDYCDNVSRSLAILIDRTSEIDILDKKLIEESVSSIDRQLSFGTYVVVRTIGAGFAINRTEFEGCVPGCPETGFLDQFIGSTCVPVRANAARTNFRQELFSKLKELSETSEKGSRSDIARTIIETSRALNDSPRKLAELVVFSDMIDNVIVPQGMILSQDPRRTLEQTIKQIGKADLRGANVNVFGFGRSDVPPRLSLPPAQVENLRSFWLAWFKESGATKTYLGVRLQ